MKILQQVKRLMLMTVLMTTVLFAELPLELQSLVKHRQTRDVLGQLYDHHMLGETDLRIMIKKHFEPLKALKVKALETTDEQQPELTQEAKAQMKELALTGLKLDLNLALGKVTPAQTPKWLNIDVVNEFSMKVTRIQEAKELLSNNAGKIKMAALVTAFIAAIITYMNKDQLKENIGSYFGDIFQKVFKKNNDFSEAVNVTVKKTFENPENLEAVKTGLHAVVADPKTKEVLTDVAGDMGSAVLNHPETKKALDAKMDQVEERMNNLVDRKSMELEARFSATADAQRAALNAVADAQRAKTIQEFEGLIGRIKLPFGKISVTPAPAPIVPVVVPVNQGAQVPPVVEVPASVVEKENKPGIGARIWNTFFGSKSNKVAPVQAPVQMVVEESAS